MDEGYGLSREAIDRAFAGGAGSFYRARLWDECT